MRGSRGGIGGSCSWDGRHGEEEDLEEYQIHEVYARILSMHLLTKKRISIELSGGKIYIYK